MKKTRKLIAGSTCIGLASLVAVTAGAWAYRLHHRYNHFAVHEAGRIYRSAWLEPDALQEVIATHGIRTVVNLCRPNEMGEDRWIAERQAVRQAGARLVELPMPKGEDPADPTIAEHIALLSDPSNYPLLVHCQHGVTRTAKLLALYDIVFRGMTGSQSLSNQPLFGRTEHSENVRAFVENVENERRKLFPLAATKRSHTLAE